MAENNTNDKIEPNLFLERILLIVVIAVFCAAMIFNVKFIYDIVSENTLTKAQMQLDLIACEFDARFAHSESLALNIVLDSEQLAEAGADDEELQAYLDEMSQKAIEETDGCCFNIYSGNNERILSSPLPFPDDFEPPTRGWYQGAVANQGELYQTEIYHDIVTGDLCYTFSCQLMDDVTVVGVDFNLEWMQEIIESMQEYSSGEALIVTSGGQIAGYSNMDYAGLNLEDIYPEYAELLEQFTEGGQDEVLTTKIYGKEYTVFFSDTGNSCYLLVIVDPVTLNKSTYTAMTVSTAISLLALAMLVLLYIYANRKRTAAVLALEEVEKANQLVGGLSQKAYRDALTGVRNKMAYIEDTKKYNDGTQKFGIVMFDVNYLKTVNDTYGHEKGDVYLKNACGLICKVFAHCPVFRLGGDEFVAVLAGDNVDRGPELIEEFNRKMEEESEGKEELWEKVNVAKGLAVFDPEVEKDTVDPVEYTYKKADQAMYKDKAGKHR